MRLTALEYGLVAAVALVAVASVASPVLHALGTVLASYAAALPR